MILIAGLGNPGEKYAKTPHNAGFMFMDAFREFVGWDSLYEVDNWEFDKYVKSEISTAKVSGVKRMIFQKPQTFMNGSGAAIFAAVRQYKISVQKEFVLVHDDLDLKLGSVKIQLAKSPKAHNGVDSVHRSIGANFLRVRIGVDDRETDSFRTPGEEYVLKPYSEEQLLTLNESIADASKQLRGILQI